MNYLELSKLDSNLSEEEVVNYLIDNNYVGVANDLTSSPNIEYSLDDLLVVWNNLKQYL